MAASRTQIYVCDIVTSQIRTGPVKMDEHKHDEHGDTAKKLDIFHSLNGNLAKTRNEIQFCLLANQSNVAKRLPSKTT